jgi:tetratricopeptide (TPR) repeat protein
MTPTIRHSLRAPIVALVLAAALVVARPVAADDQDLMARVKNYYASASYEEALQVLQEARPQGPMTAVTDAAAYQVFCLVALGRDQEAAEAIAAIVRIDPLYHPPEDEVSPRIRGAFENVRRPLLPGLVRQLYANAKGRLERQEAAEAKAEFDRVLTILEEMGAAEEQDLADLRTLASGFRDLAALTAARAAQPPPPVVPVAAAEPEPPAPVAPLPPIEPVIYSPEDRDVTKPVAISRTLPPWRAMSAVDKFQTFRGEVEILVDEAGKVVTARITDSVRADYDPALVRAAASWTFRPATRGGTPVRYRYVMEVQLTPGQ